MKEISIIGSCVCRDLFEKDTENFLFQTDIRFISPISMMSQPINGLKATNDCLKKNVKVVNGKWYRKNLLNDINKTVFTSLKERHGEYLVLDFAESRISLANLRLRDGKELLVSKSVSFRAHYQSNLKNNIFKDATIETINPLDYEFDFWKNTVQQFAKKILEIFDSNKIILIKNMPAKQYVDFKGHLHPYSSKDHFESIMCCDILLPKLNKYFIECCPECKVIEVPPHALGFQGHKWGNHPFHFSDSYYEYLLKCVKSIVLNNNDDISEIYKTYSRIFNNEFEIARLKTARDSHDSDSLHVLDKLKSYEEFNALGKKQKMLIAFALDKRHFGKAFKDILKGK